MKRLSKNFELPKKVKVKLMLYNNEASFSMGLIKLLNGVNKYGSLNKACKHFNMAYSKGLRIIRKAESDLGYRLINVTVGGSGGGGSTLTKDAENFIKLYTDLNDKLNEFATKYIEKKNKNK